QLLTTFPVEAVLVWGARTEPRSLALSARICAVRKFAMARAPSLTRKAHVLPRYFRVAARADRLDPPGKSALSSALAGLRRAGFLQNAIERRPKPYCACASTATQGWAR